jgi:proteasome lid subunit RPN8/RPN11
MTESGTERESIAWSVPQCPFRIEVSARVLDEIRVAVVDAFFSLPRGGAEIGGVLLGKFAGSRLTITDYAALRCEHAHGPSFTLSAADEGRLAELLSVHALFGGGLRPVGWYHSHTRSEIFLSEADLAVQKRFFPEPWQVALVLKPHTFQPMRIGFFFREADGGIHATASYREQELAPLPLESQRELRSALPEDFSPTVDTGVVEAPAPRTFPPDEPITPPTSTQADDHAPNGSYSEAIAETVAPSAPPNGDSRWHEPPSNGVGATQAASATETEVVEVAPPKFLLSEPERAPRSWRWVIWLAAALAIGGAAVATRPFWLPRVMAMLQPVPAAPAPVIPASLGLNSLDHEGQLQITWNRNSLAVLAANDALLEISEAGSPLKAIPLDGAHLQSGTYTYIRSAEAVDIKLIAHYAKGPDLREATGFIGKLPERKAPEKDSEMKTQLEEQAKLNAKTKTDIAFLGVKARKIEKDVESLRQELKLQQSRRLNNQALGK